MGGYQVGASPPGWAEWNGRYCLPRRSAPVLEESNGAVLPENSQRACLEVRICTTTAGCHPHAGINFITTPMTDSVCTDLVKLTPTRLTTKRTAKTQSRRRQQQRELELRRRGRDRSDAEINRLRRRQVRNFLATLLLSQGAPMITADPATNAGAPKREITTLTARTIKPPGCPGMRTRMRRNYKKFVTSLIALRKEQRPSCAGRTSSMVSHLRRGCPKDVIWWNVEGREMGDQDWSAGFVRCCSMLLPGNSLNELHSTARASRA